MLIVRGAIDHILSFCADRHSRSARSVWIAQPTDPPFGWTSIRRYLTQLSIRAPEVDVAAVLTRHRAAASLVIPAAQRDLELDHEQAQLRETMAASLESHLSHNWLLQRGLQEAWAEILSELSREGDIEIIVTLPSLLDDMSFDTLRTLFRVSPATLSSLTVGHDPDMRNPDVDSNGIAWRLSPDNDRFFLFSLRSFGRTEIVTPFKSRSGDSATARGRSCGAFGFDYEASALEALSKGSDVSETVLPTIWFCFEGFNFAGALRLGLDLLAAQPDIDPSTAADLHAIVSLSAHNLMFRSQDARLITFLEHHLRAALAIEDRPARRCALLYRLAVTLGRRKKDFKTALQWADQGISEAQTAGLPSLQARYQEAWARNIRAYLSMRLGQRTAAIEDAEAGFDLLGDVDARRTVPASGKERRWLLDAHMTRAVLSSNLCALSKQADDLAAIEKWSRREAQVAGGLPGTARFTAINWIDFHRRTMRLDLALSDAIAGIEGARSERDAYREYALNVEAGDLAYRLGDAESSLAFLKRASALRDVSDAQDTLAPLDFQIATAAIRAGHLGETAPILRASLEQGDFDADARAEIWIALATIAALAGERIEAEAQMDRAIELAVETGERTTLLRVANGAGDVYHLFGQREQARSAYERAFEIANAGIEGAPPPAADLLRTLLGLLETAEPDSAVALLGLKLLPEALQEWDAWWELSRALRCMAFAFRSPSVLDDHNGTLEGAQLLVSAAKQRLDCTEHLAFFLTNVPEELRQSLMISEIL